LGRDSLRRTLLLLVAAGLSGCAASLDPEGATVEYIGHASIMIRSPGGSEVVVDPYNGTKWLGYGFPSGQKADVVLVTHPHYDHDASYYFDASTLVLREPGSYAVGDIRIRGLEAEHAGGARYRARGVAPLNVVWVVETGGVRLAHIGDNALPSPELLAELGEVDVLFTHPFFPVDEVLERYAATGVRVIVPIHYRLPQLSSPDFRLPTVDDWLGDRVAVGMNARSVTYRPGSLPGSVEIHTLRPDPSLVPWGDALTRAWALAGDTTAADAEARLDQLREAVQLAPGVIQFRVSLAQRLEGLGEDEILTVLERGLGAAETADPQFKIEAHRLLGDSYLARGLDDLAAEQFRLALRDRRTYAVTAQAASRSALTRLGRR